MRKSLFLTVVALVSLTLAGCQKSEPAMFSGDNDAIGFAPYVSRDVTKAAVTDITASNLASFNVACYLTGSTTAYFNSEQSTGKNAAGYWETTDTYYWPASAGLDFFAYSGSGSGAVSNTGGVAKVSYKVPDAATEDFVVACAINQGKPSTSPYAQSLNFSHALSKVSQLTLAPKTGEVSADSKYKYIVTDVRIAGAKNSAEYTFNPSSGSNWGTASGEQDYAFDDKSFSFLGNSSHKLEVGTSTKVNDQLIVLPQIVTLSVTYSVEYSADSGTTWTEIMPSATKTADVDMEAGKAYNIKLQLPNDASPIVFSSSVSGWDDAVEVDKEVKRPVLLSREFSISASKKVKFTSGNLYWDGAAFHLESSQTAYPSAWDTSHVGHFFWTKTAAASYAASYSDGTCTSSDKFFCDGSDADHMITVDGVSGLYILSTDEWSHLINSRSYTNRFAKARVSGVNGLIIFPDGYNGGTALTGVAGIAAVNTKNAAYPSDNVADWSAMEKAGCVFLPMAGLRTGSSLGSFSRGYFWSSRVSATGFALSLNFGSSDITNGGNLNRSYGQSVRLVCTVL